MTFPDSGQWIAYAALAAVVALDAGPCALSMLARPLPAAALLGVLWGNPAGAAVVGAVLELAYAGILPVGASRYPEAGLAGLAGAGVALWSAEGLGAASVPLGLGWGLVAGQIGKAVETWRRSRNVAFAVAARTATEAGDLAAVPRAVGRGLAFAAVVGAATASALLGLGLLVTAPFLDLAPAALARRPPLVLLGALACGAALRLWGGAPVRAALASGASVGVLVGCLLRARGGG